jgi:hypothetical protein
MKQVSLGGLDVSRLGQDDRFFEGGALAGCSRQKPQLLTWRPLQSAALYSSSASFAEVLAAVTAAAGRTAGRRYRQHEQVRGSCDAGSAIPA